MQKQLSATHPDAADGAGDLWHKNQRAGVNHFIKSQSSVDRAVGW